MPYILKHSTQATSKYQVFLFNKSSIGSFKDEIQTSLRDAKDQIVEYASPAECSLYVCIGELSSNAELEKTRKLGFEVYNKLKNRKITNIAIHCFDFNLLEACFLEGFLLSTYVFEKYKTEKTTAITIELVSAVMPTYLAELEKLVQAVSITRDLVNEPQNILNSTEYVRRIEALFKNEKHVSLTFLDKKQLESLQMNGLLAVNSASNHPPYFAICEYKPSTFTNEKPLVLVGKGVVYDTGGLSIKPTQQSMDIMKCDMAGSAAVVGALLAASQNQLPLHIITLVPITDNWIGPKSFAPGDVLKMANGKTVEVMDTDAEGRLILADALLYAKRYNPELVIDLATLTGSAVRAIGQEATVYMGNAPKEVKLSLEESAWHTHERLVEFPLWDDYFEQLKSSIADLKNLGGPTAGAITAGKFLEQFVDYDWLHLDIAGPAFIASTDSYRGKEATGVGVRLLYNFLKGYKS